MTFTKFVAAACAAILLIAVSQSAQAVVIDHTDVNGFRTFEDTATNRIWLDLDNFRDMSVQQMINAASAAGFTWATTADVTQLWSSLPLGSGQWSGYASIMGRTSSVPAIVGVFDDGFSPLRATQGFAWNFYTTWLTDLPDFTLLSNIPVAGSFNGEWNLWAYQELQTSVPAPGALALLGLGLLGLGATRRRKPN